MRMVLAALLILGLTAACGGPCSGEATGIWTDPNRNSLELDASCSFKFSASNCQSVGTYAAPIESSGTVQVSIQSTSGGACYPVGSYSCVYALTGNALAFNCGAGPDLFSR